MDTPRYRAWLDAQGLPPFAAIAPEDIEPAIRELLQRERALVARLEQLPNPTFAAFVEPLEEMSHRIARAWSPVGHLHGVRNTPELRAAYNACLPLLSDFQTDLGQSEALYRNYQQVAAREAATLTPAQRRTVELALREFRLAGVALDTARKQRFKELMSELAQLGAQFDQHVLDATRAWRRVVTEPAELAGLNAAIVARAAQRARDENLDGWLFELDQPTYVAVMKDAESRALRRDFYEAWVTRASDRGPSAGRFDNAPVIERILALRHEAALLLGFAHYAELALARRMAKSDAEVRDLLQRLALASRPAAERELAEVERFAGGPLEAWDLAFHAERLKQQRYAVSQEELRPYFPLPRVLQGLFATAERLFGLRIEERTDAPTWHEDVRHFEISAAGGEHLGAFYLDPYARTDKRSGAWMDDCIGAKAIGGSRVRPVAHLVCNFLAPAPDANGARPPALLTHDDVVTLFHEFGHGLHHMLTQVEYPSIAGINGVAWDAVELPSQFLENFAWHPEVLTSLSGHWQTGERLPERLRDQLIATQRFHAGLATLRQLEFALFDLRLHAEYDPARGARVAELLAEVRREVAVVRHPEWNRFAQNFGHIFSGGYAAGYYSYKWAEVLAADAFAAFTENGVFDAVTAARFRRAILEVGGSRDPADAFIEFRGRPPEIDALLRQHGIAA
jgi:oligopeptidase A